MPKVFEDDDSGVYVFYCSGCEGAHQYWTKKLNGNPVWKFNGDVEKPTFTPSLLNTRPGMRCHLFVTDGKIIYCSDCDHPLAGQTVDMIDEEKY